MWSCQPSKKTIYTYIHILHIYIYTYIHIHIYTYIYIYISVVYTYIHMFIHICIHMFIHMLICLYIYTYISYIYIYTYLYISCSPDCSLNKFRAYIHRHVFRPSQDWSVWLGLTSREQLMSPKYWVSSKSSWFLLQKCIEGLDELENQWNDKW